MLRSSSVRLDVGTVMRYAVVQILHIASPWYHSPFVRTMSTSNGITSVAVRRSETANDKMKRLVVAFRRLGFRHDEMHTRVFPMNAAIMIVMSAVKIKPLNPGEKNKNP